MPSAASREVPMTKGVVESLTALGTVGCNTVSPVGSTQKLYM